MAKFNATDLKWFIGSKYIAEQTNGSIDCSTNIIDVTSKDNSGWKDKLPGLLDWKGSAEGIVEYASGGSSKYDYNGLTDAWLNRTALSVSFKTSTGTVLSGTAYIVSIKTSAPMEDKATYAIEFEGAGALTRS